MTLFIDNASFEKERLLHCVIAMRRVTRYTVYSVRGKDGEQNGTICSGTYLGREKGVFLDPGSPELADGAASVKISDAFDQSKPFPEYR